MTTLLIACSMCDYNDAETLSTLRFGQRAKSIKNKPKENIELSSKELHGLLAKAEEKIGCYKSLILELKNAFDSSGVELDSSSLKFKGIFSEIVNQISSVNNQR